jgi:hypothetical protein
VREAFMDGRTMPAREDVEPWYNGYSVGRWEGDTLIVEVTIDDPKAYTKPLTARVNNRLLPDTQLIEFVCIDKSAQHYVGSDGKVGQPQNK